MTKVMVSCVGQLAQLALGDARLTRDGLILHAGRC